MSMSKDDEKRLVGYAAAETIKTNTTVGIGTGSTVHHFIERLGQRVAEGLSIQALSSSIESEQKAKTHGIPFLDSQSVTMLDITVDGADEIDEKGQMIKGGGGALFREKLLAIHSKEMLVIVDNSKRVSQLGSHPLPVEVLPFFVGGTIALLQKHGFSGALREHKDEHYVTDNGNYIFDISLDDPVRDAQALHEHLIALPGVVETGLFFDVATALIYPEDGRTSSLTFAPKM